MLRLKTVALFLVLPTALLPIKGSKKLITNPKQVHVTSTK